MVKDIRKVIPTDVAGSLLDLATQATLAQVKAKTDNLDLPLTTLRDALRGAGNKTLTDIEAHFPDLKGSVDGLEGLLSPLLQDSTFTGRVGEVQASPTVNTVLGRLKAQQDALAQLLQESTWTARIGEVQAAPTANTVLDRLKATKAGLDALATILGEVQVAPTANTALDRLKTLAAILGEVQATPTANTVLSRLKALETALAGVLSVNPNRPLTYGTPTKPTVTNTASTIVSAGTAGVYRRILIRVPLDVVAGIATNANGSATTAHFPCGPGEVMLYETDQAISAIRLGATDVTPSVLVAT